MCPANGADYSLNTGVSESFVDFFAALDHRVVEICRLLAVEYYLDVVSETLYECLRSLKGSW